MIGVMTVTFFLIRLSGDPAAYFVDLDLQWDQERIDIEVDYARKRLGFDQPLPVQYLRFLWRIVHSTFGDSFRYLSPTTDIVFERLPRTVQLRPTQYLFAVITGLPLGILAALKRGSIIDTIATTVAVIGYIVPGFWVGHPADHIIRRRIGMVALLRIR